MTVELPASIRIGPLTYRVISSRDEVEKAQADAEGLPEDGGSWAAFSDHRHAIIGVYGDEAPSVLRHSLLHEILHCVLRLSGVWPNAYAVEWVRNRRNSGVDVEEHVVAGMAGPLLGVLIDNPQLLTWLTEDGT